MNNTCNSVSLWQSVSGVNTSQSIDQIQKKCCESVVRLLYNYENHNVSPELIARTLSVAYSAYQSPSSQKCIISRRACKNIASSLYIDKAAKRIYLLWRSVLGKQEGCNKKVTSVFAIQPEEGKAVLCASLQNKKMQSFPSIERSLLQRFSGKRGFLTVYDILEDSTFKDSTRVETTNVITDFYPYDLLSCCVAEDKKGSIRLTERQQLKVILDVLHALSAMHKARILHRDVKPDNILFRFEESSSLEPNVSAVLADFGLSVICDKIQSTHAPYGTLWYTSPEFFSTSCARSSLRYIFPQNFELEAKQDVYALGISLAGVFFALPDIQEVFEKHSLEIKTLLQAKTKTLVTDCNTHLSLCNWVIQNYSCMSPDQQKCAHNLLQESFRHSIQYLKDLAQDPNISLTQKSMLRIFERMIAVNPKERSSAQEALDRFELLYKRIFSNGLILKPQS